MRKLALRQIVFQRQHDVTKVLSERLRQLRDVLFPNIELIGHVLIPVHKHLHEGFQVLVGQVVQMLQMLRYGMLLELKEVFDFLRFDEEGHLEGIRHCSSAVHHQVKCATEEIVTEGQLELLLKRSEVGQLPLALVLRLL